jgi:large subunit ribosomal protein L22
MEKSLIYAHHNNARVSPKKVLPFTSLVRGLDIESAKKSLAFVPNKGAKLLLKVINSAEANAVNNNGLNPAELYLSEVHVGPAKPLKRYRWAGRARWKRMWRRNSHIKVGLSLKELNNG